MATPAASTLLAAGVGAAAAVAAAPYLAGLVRTVPDRACAAWWRPARSTPALLGATAATGAGLGALAGAAAGWGATLPAFLVLALAGTPLALIDVRHHRLPARLTYPLAAAAGGLLLLAAAVTGAWDHLLRAALAALAGHAVLGALRLASPRSFGGGDVVLGAVLAGYLGWSGWAAVVDGIAAGFLLGALVALALLGAGRATRRTPIPFGPMLLLGALTVLALDLAPVAAA